MAGRPPRPLEGGGARSPTRRSAHFPAWLTCSAYALGMSRGRHCKPRPPRSNAPVVLLIAVLALGVAIAPWVFDDADALRGAVSALALLCVASVVTSQWGRQSQVVQLQNEVAGRQTEARALRLELERVHTIHYELSVEVSQLRDQMSQYVVPVPTPPEPIYPSLHLPLVRAAFAQEVPPVRIARKSAQQPGERPNIGVEADSGSDTVAPRQLLDLTASEIASLRRAN